MLRFARLGGREAIITPADGALGWNFFSVSKVIVGRTIQNVIGNNNVGALFAGSRDRDGQVVRARDRREGDLRGVDAVSRVCVRACPVVKEVYRLPGETTGHCGVIDV